jgi:hypothetical protein
MSMFKLAISALFLSIVVGCGGTQNHHLVALPSDAGGLILFNDTSHAITLRGCADCGTGQVVAARARLSFTLPSDSDVVKVDEVGSRTRCLTIMQGVLAGTPTVVKVSEAGPC